MIDIIVEYVMLMFVIGIAAAGGVVLLNDCLDSWRRRHDADS